MKKKIKYVVATALMLLLGYAYVIYFKSPLLLWVFAILIWLDAGVYCTKKEYSRYKDEKSFIPTMVKIREKSTGSLVFEGNVYSLSQMEDIIKQYPYSKFDW